MAKQIIQENYLIIWLNVDKRLFAVTKISHDVKIICSFPFTLVDISESKIEISHKTKTSNKNFCELTPRFKSQVSLLVQEQHRFCLYNK